MATQGLEGLNRGSTVTFKIWLPEGAPVTGFQAYSTDGNLKWDGKWSGDFKLGQWNSLECRIPDKARLPLTNVGFFVFCKGPGRFTAYVDGVSFVPGPQPVVLADQRPDAGLLKRLKARWKPSGETFYFALIGDQPYENKKSYDPEAEAAFKEVIGDINSDLLAFTLHTGSFKSAGVRCPDEVYVERVGLFNTFSSPLVYIPGDHDWLTCKGDNPIGRLNALRKAFFKEPKSLGQKTFPVSSQSEDPRYGKFRENLLWTRGPIVFVTVNVAGNWNNIKKGEKNEEYVERNNANQAWIKTAFALAKQGGFKGLVLGMSADIGFETNTDEYKKCFPEDVDYPNCYLDTVHGLRDAMVDYRDPVLLVHGDSHQFQVDKPMVDYGYYNLMRLESFGRGDRRNWVKVGVLADNPNFFTYETRFVHAKKNP